METISTANVVSGKDITTGIALTTPPNTVYLVSTRYAKNFTEYARSIRFQDGPIQEVGVNGLTTELLLAVLIHRTKVFEQQFPSLANSDAVHYLECALESLNSRTTDRVKAGVEGTNQPLMGAFDQGKLIAVITDAPPSALLIAPSHEHVSRTWELCQQNHRADITIYTVASLFRGQHQGVSRPMVLDPAVLQTESLMDIVNSHNAGLTR